MAGRPLGSKNKPGGKCAGRIPESWKDRFTPSEAAHIKQAVLDLIESEQADNISEAVDYFTSEGLYPEALKLRLYGWMKLDPKWATELRQAQEIKADRLEAQLDKSSHPVAQIFRLKKLRPEYRDTYKFDITSEALENLLKELKDTVAPKAEG